MNFKMIINLFNDYRKLYTKTIFLVENKVLEIIHEASRVEPSGKVSRNKRYNTF